MLPSIFIYVVISVLSLNQLIIYPVRIEYTFFIHVRTTYSFMQIKAPSTLQDNVALGWERVSPRPSIMDRTYWIQVGQFLPGEKVILQQKVVRLYDGDERVSFVNVNRFRLVSASLSHRHRSIVELYN